MVTKKTNKDEVVNGLHNFIMLHNKEIGKASGMPEDKLDAIMEANTPANRLLCGHIYDWLKLEGYIE